MTIPKVYISSTFDLGAERNDTSKLLTGCGLLPKESRSPHPAPIEESCLQDVKGCDLMVLILGDRYGHRPITQVGRECLSITHLEYRCAHDHGLPVIALSRERSGGEIDEIDKRAQACFREEVAKNHRLGVFSDSSDFLVALTSALFEQLDRIQPDLPTTSELVELFRSITEDLLNWPITLPDNNWIERPELAILTDKIKTEPCSTTLILGEAGSGKSALLARLGHELIETDLVVLGLKLDYLSEDTGSQDRLQKALRLPAAILQCVGHVANTRPVVVLLDQLDALADLVIQRSERLSVLLRLIQDLNRINNVHVVASCREFDSKHDPRLRNINASKIRLSLPPWDTVQAVLVNAGFAPDAWGIDLKEILRNPAALNVFLSMKFEDDQASTISGFHRVLERQWDALGLGPDSDALRNFAIRFAERLAEREQLWLPAIDFDDQRAVIRRLISEGMLIKQSGRLGFRHQTHFEFVRAKAFLATPGSLADAVLAQQSSLRVRPLLLHALAYQRGVAPEEYWTNLKALWSPALRKHLCMLLIDYLAGIANPSANEVRLVVAKLNDLSFVSRFLPSAAQNPNWWERLSPAHLDQFLCLPHEQSRRLVFPTLMGALSFDLSRVIALIEEYWVADPERHHTIYSLLRQIETFTPESILLAKNVLAGEQIEPLYANGLCESIGKESSAWAIEVAGVYISRSWERLKPELEDSPCDKLGYSSANTRPDLRETTRDLMEGRQFDCLPALARRNGPAFVSAIWPTIVELLVAISPEPGNVYRRYRDQHLLLHDFEGVERPHEPAFLLRAAVAAIEEIAGSSPEDFRALLSRHRDDDILIIQRILAKGVIAIAEDDPAAALEFLEHDRRRLQLGSAEDPYKTTKELISALAPKLNQSNMQKLESLLKNFAPYNTELDESPTERLRRIRWTREDRLRLMRSIPAHSRRVSFRRLVQEEERAFPDLRDYDSRVTEAGWVKSPISAAQMKRSSDDDLRKLFSTVPDDFEGDRFADLKGGAREVSRELRELAKEDPNRVADLITTLEPGRNEKPVSEGIGGLADSSFDSVELYRLLLQLLSLGFSSEEFKQAVAAAVHDKATRDSRPPAELFERIRSWLGPANETKPLGIGDSKKSGGDRTHSILWQRGGITMLAHGNRPYLDALTICCLHGDDYDSWLDILDEHVMRSEDLRVWISSARYLRYLRYAEPGRSERFLNCLFERFPRLMGTAEGARVLLDCQFWCEVDQNKVWIERMIDSDDLAQRQVAAELLTVRAGHFPHEDWPRDRINAIFGTRNVGAKLLGVAHSVAEFWPEPEYRARVHPYLLKLVAIGDQSIDDALSRVFRRRRLPVCEETESLLRFVAEQPGIVLTAGGQYGIESLEPLVETYPDHIHKLCISVADRAGAKLGEAVSSISMIGGTLMSIALRLQELEEPHRSGGLDLFERLLGLNVAEARDFIIDLDKWPAASRPFVRKRRQKD